MILKKYFTLLFLLTINSNFIYSQSDWIWQNPLPYGYSLNSVKYNGNVGIAVGSTGF